MSRSSSVRLAGSAVDLACILGALTAAGMWSRPDDESRLEIMLARAATAATFAAVWVLVATRLGTYTVDPNRNLATSLRRMGEAWAVTWGVAGLLAMSTIPPTAVSIWTVLVAGLALMALARFVMSLTPWGLAAERPRAIVVGACDSARALSSSSWAEQDIDFVGYVPFPGENSDTMSHLRPLGTLQDLPGAVANHRADLAFLSPSDQAVTGDVHRAIKTCDDLGLQVQYFPSFLDVDDRRVGLAWSGTRPGLSLQHLPSASLAELAKRAIDVAGAAVGLIALAPVFVACGLAVKLTSRGPMFFKQTRVGKSGHTFGCLKFRTMRVGAHKQQELLRSASTQDGPAFKIPSDPRITPIGRILRKFSLDELPQLLNVLLGDMSLVGPRPPIPSEVEKYTWWQRRRVSVKPGLTCVWQVYGRNRVSFKRWVEMDLYYIDNWSLWLDIKLILHTIRVVFSGTGM